MPETRVDEQVDVAIVGGGHNALVAGTLLAQEGLTVAVFEAAAQVGGFAAPVVTEPADSAAGAALDFGLFRTELIERLGLKSHGLRIDRQPALAALIDKGRVTGALWADKERLLGDVSSAARPRAERFFGRLAPRLRGLEGLLRQPAQVASLGQLMRSPELLRLVSSSAREVAGEAFGDSPHAVTLAALSCAWTHFASLDQGTGLLTLLQLCGASPAGEVSQVRPLVRATGFASALAGAFEEAGGRVYTNTAVQRVLVEDGAARGVVCRPVGATGVLQVRARRVLSGVDARQTLLELVGPQHLRVDEMRAARSVRYRGAVLRLVLELEDPTATFTSLRDSIGGARLYSAGSYVEIEKAMDALRSGQSSSAPWVEMIGLDWSSGEPCRRVVVHAHGIGSDASPEEVERAASYAVSKATRDLAAGRCREVRDLRRSATDWDALGATGGDGFQGAMYLEQLFALRPLPFLGTGRTISPGPLEEQPGWPSSIRALDFCGSAAHPGGYVTGLPGLLAAERTVRALQREGR